MKKFIYIMIVTCFCSFSYQKAEAQNGGAVLKVSGTVLSSKKQPVSGVAIMIQEETSEIVTDADGRFSFECSSNDVIIFKKDGYNTVQKPATDLNSSQVIMPESLIEAGDNDNVFIPFGVRKKRVISASVNAIKGSDLPQLPLSTLNNVLAGRLPGLYVKQTGTRPGVDDASFLIRGRSSYNSSQEPVILVDGVVRDFVNMDLNEIESISVLKDAASLSWYGMNAANGVVYVTTKRGSASKTRVTFDVQGGVQTPVNITKPLDAFTYASLYNQALVSSGAQPRYTEAALEAYRTGSDPLKYPNNNFVDDFIKTAAPVQRYVATVSGGNASVRYFTLLSYYNQDGLYKGADNSKYNANSNYRRYNFRTNLDMRINPTLDVSLDVGGRVENLRYMTAGNATFLNTIFNTPANAFAVKNADGSYGGSSLFRNNPLAMLNEDGNVTDLYRTLLATLNVKQKLDKVLKGLSANIFYTYDITGLYQSGYNQAYEVYELNPDDTYTRYGNEAPLTYKTADFQGNLRNNEFWAGLDYDRNFGDHGINFSTRFQNSVSALPARLDNRGRFVANRLSYNYRQRYFADVVATYAGSQNFAPAKRYGWFPAMSAGWIVSEEKFLKKNKVVDYLKMRGSFGLVGNDDISARRFAYNNYFTRGGTQYFFGTGYNSVSNTSELELANPELSWEKATKASIGFDAKLLKQSLSLSFDYFLENRKDILTDALLPDIIGQNAIQVNAGESRYKGFESALSYSRQIGKVHFCLNGNYTHVDDKIIAINEEPGLPDYQKRAGSVNGSVIHGGNYIKSFLVAEGLFQSQAEIDAAPVQRFSAVVRPGDIKYKDINTDGVIDNLDYAMTDYSDIPTDYYGFGASAAWKGIDLSLQLQGAHGRTIQVNDLVNSGSSATGYINQFSPDSWTPEKGASSLWPRMAISDRGNNTVNSTFWLRSGDYIRLKSLEAGFTLNTKATRKLRMTSCRFYLSGFNLLTFHKLGDLPVDPEIPTAGYNSSYPYLRTFATGISINF